MTNLGRNQSRLTLRAGVTLLYDNREMNVFSNEQPFALQVDSE